MNDIILSSPCILKENEEWPTPARAIIHGMNQLGYLQRDIVQKTSAKRRTIKDILHQEHCWRSRKGKVYKPHLMSVREIRRCIRHIAKDWSTRRLSFEQVKAQLGVKASVRTIRRELRRAGYQRCIACPRPYISRKQAKKRLAFALEHRW
jgi:Transposase